MVAYRNDSEGRRKTGYVPGYSEMTVKVDEKPDMYLGFISELENLWNMKVMQMGLVVFGTIPKNLGRRLSKLRSRETTVTV